MAVVSTNVFIEIIADRHTIVAKHLRAGSGGEAETALMGRFYCTTCMAAGVARNGLSASDDHYQ